MSKTKRSPQAWWRDRPNHASEDHPQKHERRNKRLRRRERAFRRKPLERRVVPVQISEVEVEDDNAK